MDLDKFKRSAFGAVGALAIAGNHKLGLNLDLGELGVFAGFMLSLVTQSTWKAVKMAGVEAGTKVADQKAVVAVLNAEKP